MSCDICAGAFLLCDRGRGVAVVVTSWLWLCRVRRGRGCRVLGVTPAVPCPGRRDAPGHDRRDVAVASLGVAVARRGRGCGVRRLYVAVVWLRHADER